MTRMITRVGIVVTALVMATAGGAAEPVPRLDSFRVVPGRVSLAGGRDSAAVLVSAGFGPAGEADVTREATYESLDPKIASVSSAGVITPRSDGFTQIIVRHEGREARVEVSVRGTAQPSPVDFRTDVIAALGRFGCNQGACHGSPQGKNGFRLSLRGFDPDLDYKTLTRETGARRVDRFTPESSLVLRKGAGKVPHGGGTVFHPQTPAYQTLARWIAEGCQDGPPDGLVRLEVTPGARRLLSARPTQQLIARAIFRDGSSRDVTELAVFTSSDPGLASVTPGGLVTFTTTGELSVLVRYLHQITSARLTYVKHDPAYTFVGPRPANVIDELVFAKQRELQLTPAPVAGDAVFLRRVYLDVIGSLPTADEARAFLDSTDPDKREKVIDQLLQRDEFAAFWALKWADVLRGSPTTVSERGVHSFHRWLVREIAADRPMTDFARSLLTGLGNTLNKPEANFYRVARTPEDAAEAFAQLFLGVRVQCARCHNHPFEALTQTDYYGLAAYFARVQRKGSGFMIDDEVITLAPSGEVQHPLTHKVQEPVAFGTPAGPLGPDDDRRERLADWLTRPDNRYFAPAVVNRVWFHLMGSGLVDPVDDFRDTNPPSNPRLLQALAEQFVKDGSRLKPLIRTIVRSKTYQLASAPPGEPDTAGRFFTRAAVKMLSAEQILDGISTATGVAEPFKGYPLGTKAIELAEGGVNHYFLQAFSKPVRDATCECAREEDPSLPQMMHLLNNPGVLAKVKSPDSHLARWLRENRGTADVTERLYLATLTRRPTPAEHALVTRHVESFGKDRAAGFRDVQFALFNLGEFLLRH